MSQWLAHMTWPEVVRIVCIVVVPVFLFWPKPKKWTRE